MTKCDFCTKSSPSGKCWWSSRVAAEADCAEAIRNMVKALSHITNVVVKNKKNMERWDV